MYIHVHVVAGARKERVTKKDPVTLYIQVKEPAERNMANRRIRQILAEIYTVPQEQVTMLTGHRSSSKMYSIEEK